jgi:hypothetical protein
LGSNTSKSFCLQQKGFTSRGDLIVRGGLPVAVRYTNFSSFKTVIALQDYFMILNLGSNTSKSLSSFGKLLVFFITNKFSGKPEFICNKKSLLFTTKRIY